MSGTITATLTGDWREPYAVRVVSDLTGPEAATRHRTQRDAQVEMLRLREEHPGFTLVYNVCAPEASASTEPRPLTVEEFLARVPRICEKCRTSRPLNQFRQIFRKDTRGRSVMHGWAEDCLTCEEAS